MLPQTNRQVRLKSRPAGIPQAENFESGERAGAALADRQFLVRNEYLSVEPAMRGWVSAVANYAKPVGIGEVMRSFSAGTVIASRHPGFAEGDKVMGMLGWQDYRRVRRRQHHPQGARKPTCRSRSRSASSA